MIMKPKLPKGWEIRDGKALQKRIEKYPAILMGKDPYSNNFLATYGQTYLMLAARRVAVRGLVLLFLIYCSTHIRL